MELPFRIIDLKQERARKAAQLEQARRLYELRQHNAQVIQRYIRRYRTEMTVDRCSRLCAHLVDVIASAQEMNKSYTDLSHELTEIKQYHPNI